jgi:hypothetical protein
MLGERPAGPAIMNSRPGMRWHLFRHLLPVASPHRTMGASLSYRRSNSP